MYSVTFGMDKKWIGSMAVNEMSITKKMLAKLREGKVNQAKEASMVFESNRQEKDNFLSMSKILMEEVVNDKKKVLTEDKGDEDHGEVFEIKKDTPQFGDVRTSQEDAVKKAVNDNVKFDDKALRYYPDADDMTLDGKIPSLNLTFQFRYSDPSGADGLYVWTDAMQLSETNARTIGKIRDAYLNWRNSITQDGDLMEKLKQAYNKSKNG